MEQQLVAEIFQVRAFILILGQNGSNGTEKIKNIG